jgi:membrane-bound lytic murein transglycosylase F
MLRAKGRNNLSSRRGFVAMALHVTVAAVSATFPAGAREKPANTGAKTPAHTPHRTARLPKRLAADFHAHIQTRLPHLRPAFEAAARDIGFDWRVLAALGYQESRWRPAAVSPKGAQGVMMLMPVTAKKMGVKNVFAPDENIMGGARYLAYLKERIPARILDPDRTWLAMAAYNIGIGHLEDARIITQMRKMNPDRWADVRTNLPRLSDPYWHTRVKRGYARGEETAQFVERVSQFSALLTVAVPINTVVDASPAPR